MAESPQPAGVQEGIDADETPVLPVNAEDRRAAAALSALDRNADEEDEGKGKNVADSEALGQAMKNLAGSEQEGGGTATAQRDEKKVKVDAADVSLLVRDIELEAPTP